jgi:hypothetical protein
MIDEIAIKSEIVEIRHELKRIEGMVDKLDHEVDINLKDKKN